MSSLILTSTAFSNEHAIPSKFTCEGADVSPSLTWAGIPTGTKSFALIVDDPDAPDPKAPKMTWVHWVVWDIPASTTSLGENAAKVGLPVGAREGKNDWKKAGWGGPCPPTGRHRYFFKLYALDTRLPELSTATKADLEKAMRGHILGEAQLLGTYEKGK